MSDFEETKEHLAAAQAQQSQQQQQRSMLIRFAVVLAILGVLVFAVLPFISKSNGDVAAPAPRSSSSGGISAAELAAALSPAQARASKKDNKDGEQQQQPEQQAQQAPEKKTSGCNCPPPPVCPKLDADAQPAQQKQKKQAPKYRKWVDPHLDTCYTPPGPDGKPVPYTGPFGQAAQHGRYCSFRYNMTDFYRMMEEDPEYVAPLPNIFKRDDIADVLVCEGKKIGAELGVQHGTYAALTMGKWDGFEEYWLVDLWQQQQNYADNANHPNHVQDQIMKTALQSTARFKDKVKVCRNFTTECAKRAPDNYFDYIYVDARHDRMGVLEDLKAWWPKLKRGSIMCGHDYISVFEMGETGYSLNADGTRDQTGMAVRGAVDDFFASPNSRGTDHYRPQIAPTYREPCGAVASWCVRK